MCEVLVSLAGMVIFMVFASQVWSLLGAVGMKQALAAMFNPYQEPIAWLLTNHHWGSVSPRVAMLLWGTDAEEYTQDGKQKGVSTISLLLKMQWWDHSQH